MTPTKPETKLCTRCQKEKPVKRGFYSQLRHTKKRGLFAYSRPICMDCQRTASLERYYRNKARKAA